MERIARRLVAPLAALLTLAATLTTAPAAQARQADGDPVVGIPRPCPTRHAWPADASMRELRSRLQRDTGITLAGSGWDDPANRPLVRIVWETLDGLSCTDYVSTIRRAHPGFTLNAAPISGWAWGDWGLTRPGAVTLDFGKWRSAHRAGDDGRLVRLLVHEMGHAWSRTPQAQRTYARFGTQYARTGQFSSYGNNVNENFSEAVGYYVARCAAANPYDPAANRAGRFDAYYRIVRDGVFDGREFGPRPGTSPDCSLQRQAVTSTPAPRRGPRVKHSVTRVPKESLDAPPGR